MIKTLIMPIICLLFLYLLGAFVETTFDISLWRQGLREMLALLTLPCIVAGFGIGASLGENND